MYATAGRLLLALADLVRPAQRKVCWSMSLSAQALEMQALDQILALNS